MTATLEMWISKIELHADFVSLNEAGRANSQIPIEVRKILYLNGDGSEARIVVPKAELFNIGEPVDVTISPRHP
jgi:hypothetical protein